jgi:hypothetical protein
LALLLLFAAAFHPVANNMVASDPSESRFLHMPAMR